MATHWFVTSERGCAVSPEKITKTLNNLDIRPDEIKDRKLRKAFHILINLVEEMFSNYKKIKEENQKLKDENNLLKGEKTRPDNAGSKKKNKKDESSEKERKKRRKRKKKI